MNSVELTGRLVRDPDIREKVTSFTLAVDRMRKEDGADYPRIVCFGKRAEMVKGTYKKGMLVEVQGRIVTSSYDGKYGKVYTTDIVADEVKVLDWNREKKEKKEAPIMAEPRQEQFASLDEDVPF